MNDTWFTELLDLVLTETRELDTITAERKRFALAVQTRDWNRLEACIESLQDVTEKLSSTERRRAELWNRLRIASALPADSGIVRVLFAVPEPFRSILHDAIRQMKVSAIRARIEGEAVTEYVSSTASTIKGVVEGLYPERKGRIYGRSGRAVAGAGTPLVLDTAL
ncbi:MAG: hypothetical protein NT080_10650 [Spirochaetes bacterium]|nr:hypothetical protein [Spirochaetota bacterium]